MRIVKPVGNRAGCDLTPHYQLAFISTINWFCLTLLLTNNTLLIQNRINLRFLRSLS